MMEEKQVIELVRKMFRNVNEKKVGDTPVESLDLVNKAYLQFHGTTAQRPTPSSTERTMYFNDTTGKPNFWTGSSWVLADGTAA